MLESPDLLSQAERAPAQGLFSSYVRNDLICISFTAVRIVTGTTTGAYYDYKYSKTQTTETQEGT